jgi:glycosyltransferase involved in cell wall biosynthesis
MRLLFVHDRIGAFGGAEANILVTARELLQRGHSVGLAYGNGTGGKVNEWQEVFIDRIPLGTSGTDEAMEGALTRFQPDIIYLHKLSDPKVLEVLAECGRPVVRMVHDHDLYCMRSYKYNYLSRRICTRPASAFCVFPCGASLGRSAGAGFPIRWISYHGKLREIATSKRFRRLIVASEYMRAELLRNGFGSDQIEIHAPVPCAATSTLSPSFDGRNLIVYAGQIIRGKGVDVLLESLAKVKSHFECVILGDGSQRAECERLSRSLGLEGRVHFKGFVPQASIADYYRDASLSVMSSLWPEPFGATGLEAMRCGLPVVAFDAGGIREWLLDGVNGILVPWMDREGFARGVDTLLADKALACRMGRNGRELVDERYGFAAYVDRLENLFSRTADRSAAKYE